MKKSDFVILFVLALLVLVFFFVLAPPVNEISDLEEELRMKRRQQELLQQQTKDVERQIDRLRRSDPAAIEAIARDKFGYCRPGEDIYYLEMPQETSK